MQQTTHNMSQDEIAGQLGVEVLFTWGRGGRHDQALVTSIFYTWRVYRRLAMFGACRTSPQFP